MSLYRRFAACVSALTLYLSISLGLVSLRSLFAFTFWNICVQLAHFALLPSARMRRVAWVMATLMQLVFWAVFAYDRELIHSRHLQVPMVLNHLQHTAPLLLLVGELLTRQSTTTIDDKHWPSCATLTAYMLACLACRAVSGRWPYAFLEPVGTAAFCLLAPLVVAVAYAISWFVGNVV
jgi:hypothetical protein